MDSKVIEKIQKLFALSNDNPSEEEAVAAALKAQQLMAKHKITMSDVDAILTNEEAITSARYHCGNGLAWKFPLAAIVAQNFRCKTFSYGKQTIAFYGYETDAQIAKDVFEFLFKAGHKLANKEVYRRTKERGTATGVYNSFCIGYMEGIKEELGKQCKALMIVIPPKVNEEYETYSSTFKKGKARRLADGRTFDSDSYSNGKTEGANIMRKKELANGLA